MYSEVFEEFVKIAQAKDRADADRKRLENTRRNSSEEVKKLEELYNIKPEQYDGLDYENNMAEVAHPETSVLYPAYDKPNGIIENVNERHSLIKEVINRTPRGQHTNRKVMAQQELALNLVRLGNDLENNNNTDLSKLSDQCLNQLTKTANPIIALLPFVARTIGLSLLTSSVFNMLPSLNKGLERNGRELIEKLDDIINSDTSLGFGVRYKPDFVTFLMSVRDAVESFLNNHMGLVSDLNNIEIKDAKHLLNDSKELSSVGESNEQNIENMKNNATKLYNALLKLKSKMSNSAFMRAQVEEKGGVTSLLEDNIIGDAFQNVANPFNDVNKVVKEMDVFTKSLSDLIRSLNASKTSANKGEASVSSQLAEMMASFSNKDNKDNKQNSNDIDFG